MAFRLILQTHITPPMFTTIIVTNVNTMTADVMSSPFNGCRKKKNEFELTKNLLVQFTREKESNKKSGG